MRLEQKNDEFEWIKPDLNIDDEYNVASEKNKSIVHKVYIRVLNLIFIMFIVAIAIRIFRYSFDYQKYQIFGININTLLNIFLSFIWPLILLICVKQVMDAIFNNIQSDTYEHKFKDISHLIILFLWFLYSYLKAKTYNSKNYYNICRAFKNSFLTGIFATIMYINGILFMTWFRNYFIKKTLKSKIKETKITEKILQAFKKYI